MEVPRAYVPSRSTYFSLARARFGTKGGHTGHLCTGHTGPGGPWPYWPYWPYWPLEWPPAGTPTGPSETNVQGRSPQVREPVQRDRNKAEHTDRAEAEERPSEAGAWRKPHAETDRATTNEQLRGARPQLPERENDVEQARQPTVTESGLDTCSKGTGEPQDPKIDTTQIETRGARHREDRQRDRAGAGDRREDGAKRDAVWGPRTSGQSQQVASSGQPMRASRNAARSEDTPRRPRSRRGSVWKTGRAGSDQRITKSAAQSAGTRSRGVRARPERTTETRRAPSAPEQRRDTRADRAAGTRWTTEPIEKSEADAIYCPVLDAGRWNGVMHVSTTGTRGSRGGGASRSASRGHETVGGPSYDGPRTTAQRDTDPVGPLLLRRRVPRIGDPGRRPLRGAACSSSRSTDGRAPR